MTTKSVTDWKQHLKAMTVFAKERRERAPGLELASTHRYIRIGGNGFRPVSLHPDNPCGALYQGTGPDSQIGETANLELAISEAKRAHQLAGKPGTRKTEHHLQAYLIHQALTRPEQWSELLGCQHLFEELIFLADEFRLGEIRADLIALGRKDGWYFPVYIELKAERLLTRLKEQLEAINTRMDEAGELAREFLAAASGVAKENIALEQAKRVLVWPDIEEGRESAAVAKARAEEGYITIGYRLDDNGYQFRRDR